MLEVVQRHLEIARRDARRSPKVLKSLAATSKACSHASDVTKQILAFGTASDSAHQATELTHVVREAVQLARATLRNSHVVRYSDAGNPPLVSMDTPQFQQAIISLLLVASRSLGKRPGEVTVHVDAVAIPGAELGASGNAAESSLARIGIEARSAGAASDGGGRTSESAAIGLAAAGTTDADVEFPRRVIAAHQGATIVNVGSDGVLSISVYLPIAPARPGEAPVDGGRLSRGVSGGSSRGRAKGRLIMYVDDHKWLLPLAERLLADSGFEVRGFVDPRAALDALHERLDDFGLIATDYKMSKITGLDIARAAKAARPDVPVVIISAYITEALKLQALRAGADAVIHKSSLTTELVPTVSRLMPPLTGVAAPA